MGSTPSPLVCYLLPSFGGGGAERIALNIMHGLPEANRRLVLFEKNMDYACDAPLSLLAGDFTSGPSRPRRLYQAVAGAALLFRLKQRAGAASWLSFTTLANILNVLTPIGGKIVVSAHCKESEAPMGNVGPLIRRLISLTYSRADAVVAVSETVKQDLVQKFGVPEHKITTIYNSVDLEEVAELARRAIDPELSSVLAQSSIVTVGRLIEGKGYAHLLRVFASLKKRLPEAKLLIIGKGPQGKALVDDARALSLRTWAAWEDAPRTAVTESDVVFTGFVSNPFALVARAKVFAFSSFSEGFGNAILEAMACGVPTVVADSPAAPREILAPGTSWRVISAPEYASAGILMPVFARKPRPLSDPPTAIEETWAETLLRVLQDNDLREEYGRRGRERARAFSMESIGAQWRTILLGHGEAGHLMAASTASMTASR